jgi:Arc/MetJ family transcription regulator
MRTNIVLDDVLVEEAFRYAGTVHTEKGLIELALKEFIQTRKLMNLKDLKGKISFSSNHDYKKMRVEN